MKSCSFYLATPYKDGVSHEIVKAMRKEGKSITKLLNDQPTIIYLTLTFANRKLVRVNTHEKVKAIYWSFDTQSVRVQMHGSLILNDRLQFLRGEVMRQYRLAITANKNITLPEIKKLVEGVIANNTPDFDRKPFVECFKEFIEERKPQMN